VQAVFAVPFRGVSFVFAVDVPFRAVGFVVGGPFCEVSFVLSEVLYCTYSTLHTLASCRRVIQ
jgi:hypothetical protein